MDGDLEDRSRRVEVRGGRGRGEERLGQKLAWSDRHVLGSICCAHISIRGREWMNEQGDGLVLIKDVECLNGIAQHLVHMFVSNGSR